MDNDEIKILTAGTLARIIADAREKQGWSVYKLSQKSGVATAHIYRLEEGILTPRTDTLQKLCCALKIEITFPLAF